MPPHKSSPEVRCDAQRGLAGQYKFAVTLQIHVHIHHASIKLSPTYGVSLYCSLFWPLHLIITLYSVFHSECSHYRQHPCKLATRSQQL